MTGQIRTAVIRTRDLIERPDNTRQPDEGLIESIRADGLWTPILVGSDMVIADGHRRLRALRIIGEAHARCEVHESLTGDELRALRAEIDTNDKRQQFTPLELAKRARRLEELTFGPAAKARQEATRARPGEQIGDHIGGGSADPPPIDDGGKARDLAAVDAGLAPKTYARIRAIQNAAANEQLPPEVRAVAEEALADIERTGKVAPANQKVIAAKKAAGVTRKGRSKRAEQIRPLAADGMTANQIAARLDMTATHVHQVCKAQGIDILNKEWMPSADRADQIRPLAARGMSSRQISAEIGISEQQIYQVCKVHGIEVPADAAIKRTRRQDSTRIIRETIYGLEGTRIALDLVDWPHVHAGPDDLQAWVTSLDESFKSLKQMRTRLKEMTQ